MRCGLKQRCGERSKMVSLHAFWFCFPMILEMLCSTNGRAISGVNIEPTLSFSFFSSNTSGRAEKKETDADNKIASLESKQELTWRERGQSISNPFRGSRKGRWVLSLSMLRCCSEAAGQSICWIRPERCFDQQKRSIATHPRVPTRSLCPSFRSRAAPRFPGFHSSFCSKILFGLGTFGTRATRRLSFIVKTARHFVSTKYLISDRFIS